MLKTLTDFAQTLNLPLTQAQAEKMLAYANLVWGKKDFLNLTSAADLNEVITRHICDGLTAAAKINGLIHAKKVDSPQVADVGAGAGYIGITVALALPEIQVTLVESIEKRCSFMNWALMQLGIKNAKVKQARLGQGTSFQFDFVTERAMGQLPDILEICLGALKPGGVFIAFQGEHPQADMCHPEKYQGILLGVERYTLPDDNKKRHLALFGRI
ncbi:16S rRNA (guanine(527)-N(7))-methyltransferase RsmG [Candidatus Avelusimicrobium sp.]|uniref:16S rRNA (guanine(527)-N(7))-methyltransferase RsmG n=1 Tax=Candidatus Avelusimicrobium sp. TaxID=3048833 RepID=UPI003D7C674B